MLQGTIMHVSPDALQPAVVDWGQGEVYLVDATTEEMIGKARISTARGNDITVRLEYDFPSDFFEGRFAKWAAIMGIRYDKLTGLPPADVDPEQETYYKNTKVISRVTYHMDQKAAKKRKELVGAILERFERGKDYTMVDLLPAMAAVGFSSLTISGSIASKAIGELLAQGFLTFTYDASEDTLVFRRL